MKIIIINGPNLNLLGSRNQNVYGDVSFDKFFLFLKEHYKSVNLSFYQSNIEGELIDKLQEVDCSYDYIILNGGGYTHSSVAIADCIEAINTPVIEVHISNIYARESFRRRSLFSSFCLGSIVGFGLDSYRLAVDYVINLRK
ncbi:MAG: 3-dehydroquinate dehydratase [Flavobacteriales bacterium]|jgi:3-dehydroquinate dehydratase-2|nr:3-dehydroquinate dehydratase [Flavobacteriales bacterium]|tara:strand:+ start:1136 stop:1561 length:426 start_codon:yes stop_codon:yes gene_type:complete